MTIACRDPLLRTTRLLLRITMAIAIIVGLVLIAGGPLVWIFGNEAVIKTMREGMHTLGTESLIAINVLMLGGLVLVGLAIQFLRKLIALIDSLEAGSPFIAENAVRLRTMGWLALAMQGVALVALPLGVWIDRALPGGHVVFTFSFEGLIAALLLFILARVFEQGTKLVEDVEGTV
jgi:hypothetical protein